MNRKLWGRYSLKYNPFSPEVPTEAFYVNPMVEDFCWRVEHQLREGGFAQVLGDPGTGKSVALRILSDRLSKLPDVAIAALSRPQASLADLYRELGDLFCVALKPCNRWAGTKALRLKWQAHIESSLLRPVLIVDEAQEMNVGLLSELRMLASVDLDARSILTVVLSGDQRLVEKLQRAELQPLAGRIRARLRMENLTVEQLLECLCHALKQAGNASLMTKELMQTLCEHAMGNLRVLMNMANELLVVALKRELERLDEKLFLEVVDPQAQAKRRRRA